MKKYNVAVIGVGVVGVEILKTLKARNFPVDSIRVFGRSARDIDVEGTKYSVEAIANASFDGIEMIRKINFDYGNGCVIGIISSSDDNQEIEKAKKAGAQFWIIKSDDIEPRLEEFKEDYEGYKNKTNPFKIYR